MRVLWITNILFPAPCQVLKLQSPVVGGWMYASAKTLMAQADDLELAVATVYDGASFQKMELNNICYYLLPLSGDKAKYHQSLESKWQKVNADFHPDVVHLHGSEFAHGLAFLRVCSQVKSVVSIQGLVSVCSRYYLSNMTFREIISHITIRDILKMDTLWQQKRKFASRGKMEREVISRVSHVIGRTSWDKAHIWGINPEAKYHFCNETLRDVFYTKQWSFERCEKHSIFLSQAGYPIKGLHQILKALPYVLREYPDTKIYVAGDDILSSNTLVKKLKISGYTMYLRSLIRKYALSGKIVFTGLLDEQQICSQYLSANLFVCPSSIENSPNSLGEAQLLGVPCLASYVGGIPDMMQGNEEHTYRFEEVEMLAQKICEVFAHNHTGSRILDEMRLQAFRRHDRMENAKQLLRIYNKILLT